MTRPRGTTVAPRAALVTIAALLLVAAGARPRAQSRPPAPAPIALTHVTMIDGTGAPARPNTTVVIRNGRIAAVFTDGAEKLPDGAAVEDLTGRFLVPGLIDAHVHITGQPTTFDQYRTLLDGLVAHGITGIRDMAGDARILSYLSREALLDEQPWPDIYYSALMAGPTFFAEDPRVPGTSQGVLLGGAPWMRSVDATTNIRMAVAEARGTGATGVKLYANLPAAIVKAITTEAHRQGLLVWTHATIFPAKPSDAVDAGADSISHTPYLSWEAAPKVPQDYRSRAYGPFLTVKPDDPRILSLLDAMKAHGTVLDATLRVFQQEAAHDPAAVGEEIMPWSYAVTKEAHERGVLVDAGTDSQGLPMGKNGPDVAATPTVLDELALLVGQCGFTPLEAIHSATQVNATVVGQGATRGTITPNKQADLVVLAADPTADIHNLKTVVEVFKDGKKVVGK
ncbi:MAG TPA: amidohydrolase family protein [Vicinamibacterales bacterium]|nr:amidohydrolase family protein [Vicinamibacterales bacterium]